jgi:undecaprenyl-diphosphatase
MVTQFHALVLGIVQGLTEFLPVSSSAHLALIPWLFGWQDPGLAFDVALHLGTLAGLLVYYWRDWAEMAASVFNGDHQRRRLLLLLIIASIPGAIFGVLLEKRAETTFRSPLLIAFALAALGVALWRVDKRSAQSRAIGEIGLRDAILIGLSQALALIPGVSRSGITITVARALGMRRQDAANFSFLMATPIIAGAGLLKAREMIHAAGAGALAAGFVAAALAGLLAISALVRFVRTRSYVPFAWYRIAVAALVAVVFAMSA